MDWVLSLHRHERAGPEAGDGKRPLVQEQKREEPRRASGWRIRVVRYSRGEPPW